MMIWKTYAATVRNNNRSLRLTKRKSIEKLLFSTDYIRVNEREIILWCTQNTKGQWGILRKARRRVAISSVIRNSRGNLFYINEMVSIVRYVRFQKQEDAALFKMFQPCS